MKHAIVLLVIYSFTFTSAFTQWMTTPDVQSWQQVLDLSTVWNLRQLKGHCV